MAVVVHDGEWITGAAVSLTIAIQYPMGGHEKSVYLGEVVHIKTKFGNQYSGILQDFEYAEEEGKQDSLVIENQDGKVYHVGIHDISYMETVKDDGWMD